MYFESEMLWTTLRNRCYNSLFWGFIFKNGKILHISKITNFDNVLGTAINGFFSSITTIEGEKRIYLISSQNILFTGGQTYAKNSQIWILPGKYIPGRNILRWEIMGKMQYQQYQLKKYKGKAKERREH